jgi:hypothetical protein
MGWPINHCFDVLSELLSRPDAKPCELGAMRVAHTNNMFLKCVPASNFL